MLRGSFRKPPRLHAVTSLRSPLLAPQTEYLLSPVSLDIIYVTGIASRRHKHSTSIRRVTWLPRHQVPPWPGTASINCGAMPPEPPCGAELPPPHKWADFRSSPPACHPTVQIGDSIGPVRMTLWNRTQVPHGTHHYFGSEPFVRVLKYYSRYRCLGSWALPRRSTHSTTKHCRW